MKKEKAKKTFKRISLPKTIRLTIIGIIAIILLFSIIKVYTAYSTPETTKITYETLSYNHNSKFNYRVYLKNNTVYEGKEYLNPGEGSYFKKIIDKINASFIYNFYISEIANISGYYSLNAEIKTSYWTKKYTIIPTKKINLTGTSLNINEEFIINYPYYEEVVNKISQEIGLTVTNPNVIYKFDIFLNIDTEGTTLMQSYTPSINLTISSSTIEISEELSDSKKGAKTETKEIFHQDIINERQNWTIISLIILVILTILSIVTRSDVKKPSIEKTLKKIIKKNGEWIVEVEKPIKELITSETVYCKTMDDLIKISEQLAKPVIHVQKDKKSHTFYVLENTTCYQYNIKDDKENL